MHSCEDNISSSVSSGIFLICAGGTQLQSVLVTAKLNFPFSIIAAQEVLGSLNDRWFQADNSPTDKLLNEQEFLSFLHPEHSRGMLKYMVKEIMRDLGTVYFLNLQRTS